MGSKRKTGRENQKEQGNKKKERRKKINKETTKGRITIKLQKCTPYSKL